MTRLKSTATVAIVVLVAGIMAARAVRADAPLSGDPLSVIKTGVSQVIDVFNDQAMSLDQRRAKLRAMSLQYFDFESMAKSSLGYHWRDLTPGQRNEFVPLFTGFIQDAYLSKMEQATVEKVRQEAKTADVRFTRQAFYGIGYAEVFSTIVLQDQKDPIQVNYMLHQSDGRWRVYDLTIESISLIGNYRNQFNRVINNQGYPTLVNDLKAKREQLRQYMDEQARNSGVH